MNILTKIKSDGALKFIRVRKDGEHTKALYKLLKSRIYNISNSTIPSYEEHEFFVKNHPYRVWYLIQKEGLYVGSLYILRDNCIGIYAINEDAFVIKNSIYWVIKKYKPLPAIKSVRASNFFINISPDNKLLIELLYELNAELLQLTFAFKW